MHSMLAICFCYTISYVSDGTGRHAYHFSTFYRISRANLALRLRRLWLTPFCLPTPHSIKGEYDVSAKASSSNWDSRCKSVGPCYKKCTILISDRGGIVVKVLCYKSEGRLFDSRWCHWNFSLT